jgi:hypothetical protein
MMPSNRIPVISRPALFWLLFLLCMAASSAALAESNPEKLIQALEHPSFKVRLQAAILIGKQGFKSAIPHLRKALADPQDSVRAAAAVSLGHLGDQTARSDLTRMLSDSKKLIWRSAEKALALLDKTGRSAPRVLVAIDRALIPRGVASSRIQRVDRVIKRELGKLPFIVLDAGEHTSLKELRLAEHLKARNLSGVLLQPKIMRLDGRRSGAQTALKCKVSIMTLELVRKRMEFTGAGSAEADVPTEDLAEYEGQLLDAAVQAATEEVANFIRRR